MRQRAIGIAALLLVPGAALAQGTPCSPYQSVTQAFNVCSAAVDGTRLFHPALGLLVGGGNPRLGTAGTLGGLGHVAFDLRVTATKARLPDLGYNGTGTTVAATDTMWVPGPVLDASIGIAKGTRSGFGGLDLLLSTVVLPKSVVDKVDNLSIDTTGSHIGSLYFKVGIGARLQLLGEQGPRPAISVSGMRRSLPGLAYGNLSAGDNYSYAVDLQEWNWRLIASKRFAILGLAAGGGFDKYTGDATIAFRNPVTTLPEPPIALELSQTRSIFFVDGGIYTKVVRFVGEAGWQGGKDLQQTITFEGNDPKASRFFASATLGFAF